MASDADVTILYRVLDDATATLNRIEGSTKRLDSAFGSLLNRLKTGIQWHILNNIMNSLDRAFRALKNAIPDLIARGEDWARTVDDIADKTGLAAERASTLAAVQLYLTGNTGALARGLIQLARSAVDSSDKFAKMGIAVRDSNGRLLDAWTILGNIRRRISETGSSLLTTNAAQKAFGRGSGELLDLLKLSQREWRIYAADARRAGLVLDEAALRAAEQWERTRRRLDASITGIGSQLLNRLAPLLTSIVDGITSAIHQNLDNIVRFLSQVAAFILSTFGALFGIDFGATTLADRIIEAGEKLGKGGRGLKDWTRSAKDASKATDDLGKATTGAASGLAAHLRPLREAQRGLPRLRRETIFKGDMSRLERVLWDQAHQARIKEARERIAEARKAIQDRRADAGQMVDLARSASKAAGLEVGRIFGPRGSVSKGIGAGITAGLEKAVTDAKTAGQQFGNAIRDTLFGPARPFHLGGGMVGVQRGGGLIDKLAALIDALGRTVEFLTENTE